MTDNSEENNTIINRVLNYIKNHKRIFIILTAIFIVLLFVFSNRGNEDITELVEIEVERGNVSRTLSSSGNIDASESRFLSFGVPGVIGEVLFDEGDDVQAGDIIAKLDMSTFEADVLGAQGSLNAASANYSKIANNQLLNIQELLTENANIDKEVSDFGLETSKEVNANSLESAEIGLDIAKQNNYGANTANEELESEQEAAEEYQESIGASNEYIDFVNSGYETRKATSNSSAIVNDLLEEQAHLEFDSTKENLENANVAAEKTNEQVSNLTEISNLQLKQAKTDRANDLKALNGQINQAKSALTRAQYNLDQAIIKAPFAGTILNIPLKSGEYYGGPGLGSAVSIGNLQKYIVKAEVNELDIFNIEIGQKVVVDFEADFGETFKGEVIKINPGPKIVDGGVITYIVEISVPESVEKAYPGMSVDLDFIAEEKQDVLIVPIIAIEDRDDGFYVKVKSGNNIEDRKVEVGLEGDIDVEIISGLQEGEVVVY